MEAAEEPACGGCHNTLESASGGVVVAFGNALWHVECFRCAKCRTTVSADTNLLLLADGSPVCQSCSYSCHVCHNPILDEAIMTGDDSYHAACFKCRSCSRRIEELVFAKTSQGIYCMNCHNDRVARSRRHAEHKKRSRTKSRKDDSAPQSRATDHAPSPSIQSPATPAHPSNSTRRHPTEPHQPSPALLSSSPSPALLATNPGDLGKRRKSYDDGVRPLNSFFGMGPGVTSLSPPTGKSFATQQGAPEDSGRSSPGGLGVPAATTSRADKRRSINPGLVMPSVPDARPRGNSASALNDERGRLSPYSMEEQNYGVNSVKNGAGGSISSRAASPSPSNRSRIEDIFETAPPPPPALSRGRGPSRAGSTNTRAESIDTRAGSIDMQLLGHDQDTISIFGPGEGEITMMFEEPSFTLDEPTFVLDEPTVTMGAGRGGEMDITTVATHGSRAGGGHPPENANLSLGGMNGAGGAGISASIGRSRSPSFGRNASPTGLGMDVGRTSRSPSPAPGRIPSPNGAGMPRSASPGNFERSISPHDMGRGVSPNGAGRSISPVPPNSGSTLGRNMSPNCAPTQPPNGTGNTTYGQGKSTSPLVTKSASQSSTPIYASNSTASRNPSPAPASRAVVKSASQGATASGSVNGVKAPVAKGTNGMNGNGTGQGVNGGHTLGINGGHVQGTNGTSGQSKVLPTPTRSRSGARESLPPPAVPPKDKAQEVHHQHTPSYPMLQHNGLGSIYAFPSGSNSNATSTPTSTTTSNASNISRSTNHTSRPTHPRSSSSSSSSPVIEHTATATYGAMQLPPMRFSLSDTDFADLLKGVGVDENGKLRLSQLGVSSGRGSLDQDRNKNQTEEDKSKPVTVQEKNISTLEQEKRRPSVEAEPRPSISSESRMLKESLFAVIPEATDSATASILDNDEEEFGQGTSMATPIIRTTLAPTPTPSASGVTGVSSYLSTGRERLDSGSSPTAQSDAIVRRLKEMAEGAQERGSTSVKINLEFLDAITKAVTGSRDKYSDLKGRYDGMKRTSQQFIDGLSVAQSEYDKELAARRDAEAEVTRLRVQLSGQAARLTAMSAETRIREVSDQQTTDANNTLRTLLREVGKFKAERDMIVTEIDELGKRSFASSGGPWEPLEGRLEAVRKQYRKDLEGLNFQREGLVKEITELKEHRDIFLEETTALNARNEELAELNAQIQRQVEHQVTPARPPLPHMDSSGVPTQLSLGSSLKEFGVKPRSQPGTINAQNASVSSMGTVTSVQSSATATTSNVSIVEEKDREREDIKMIRVQTPQEPVAATGAKGGFKWLKGKAPPKEPIAQVGTSGKIVAAATAAPPERSKNFTEHNFVQQSVLRFARCDQCGDKMWGMQSRCSNCNIACHQRCMYSVKSLCQNVSAPAEEPVVDISPLPPSMFGRDLIEQVRADAKNDPGRMVPMIVDKCIRAVEASAMDYEGIYRKSGGSSQSKAITQLFERGNYTSFNLEDTDSFNDISSITSVMKTYFRQLPDPLLTFALHEKFVEAAAIRDPSAKYEALASLVRQLPPEHYHTLRYLMLHLSRIKDCSEENLMNARNIGVVFGPTLLRSADPSREFGDMAGKALTVEWLVDNAPTIFSDPTPT